MYAYIYIYIHIHTQKLSADPVRVLGALASKDPGSRSAGTRLGACRNLSLETSNLPPP